MSRAAQAANQIRSAALGLIAAGIQPGDRVGLMSKTRYEWVLLDFAILVAGARHGADLRDLFGGAGPVDPRRLRRGAALRRERRAPRDVRRPRTASCPSCATSGASTVRRDGAARADRDRPPSSRRTRATAAGRPRPGDHRLHLGHHRPPKGCALTHRNLLSEVRGGWRASRSFCHGEWLLLFLPLAHVFGRALRSAASPTVTLGFTSDIKNLVPTLGAFRPTLILSVPRVFEKVYNSAEQNARRRQGQDLRIGGGTAIA